MDKEIVGGIILAAVGLCLALVPTDRLWSVTGKLMTKEGSEPSKNFAAVTKALGIVVAVIGAWLFIGEILD